MLPTTATASAPAPPPPRARASRMRLRELLACARACRGLRDAVAGGPAPRAGGQGGREAPLAPPPRVPPRLRRRPAPRRPAQSRRHRGK
ncbi:hypothetical protein PVAP13_6NG133803 [Panicum virgatum]|uniref:Uncharacterized protein n=2 Tax=Panicum virgatum TaxID=38727 RepID=A0A8T0R1E8_PANVG|nr:hypothetical protein PVAP13_6NG133803 [Panicum virgatum]